MREINLVGQTFGRLTVTEMLPEHKCMCNCACGTSGFVTWRYAVKRGLTQSCGCLKREKLTHGCNLSHGESRAGSWSPEYRAWVNMLTRCYNPKSTRYSDWGGRGITVCNEWQDDFTAFLAYVGRRPTAKHSLDRYPNSSGNYEPGNVRWATPEQQSRNQRSCRVILAFGKSMTVADWSDAVGLEYSALLWRLDHGWDAERAVSTPSKRTVTA